MNQIYKANITAGTLLVSESRKIADLMFRDVSADEWTQAIAEGGFLHIPSKRCTKELNDQKQPLLQDD